MQYLALGDSYTIGEQVAYGHSFPHQLVAYALQNNIIVNELKVIATTGHTTNELIGPMELQVMHNNYDLVTLLIGVNNQYRGRPVSEFAIHFAYILNRAIHYAQGKASQVIVLSIPDWGLTPFNTERDKAITSAAIDSYNATQQLICQQHNVQFIDVTTSTRANAQSLDYLAPDQLHPSAKEYAIWASKIAQALGWQVAQ
jgi:lysophospholipase L1-like esterase